MSSLKYWVWLSSLQHLGASGINALLGSFGTPESIFYADEADLRSYRGLNAQALEGLLARDLNRAESILEQCDKLSIRVMTIRDADYPERLGGIHAPPAVLYISGRLPDIDEEAALAVVGSRKATAYGVRAAHRLSFSLAGSGMLIVSGLAEGIDAAAHSGALQAGAPTVAVLGCGTDIAYPAVNRALYSDIAATGALVSEYPPSTPPIASHFPARNRIINGLSLGVLVVEASPKSGALITVRHALEEGRDVFAVPGNIDSGGSVGCNGLLREGAILVTEPEDILGEYMSLYNRRLTAGIAEATPASPSGAVRQKPAPKPKKPAFDLDQATRDFPPEGRTLMLAIADKEQHVDELIAITGLPAAKVLRELTMLELGGKVRALPGKRFAISAGFMADFGG